MLKLRRAPSQGFSGSICPFGQVKFTHAREWESRDCGSSTACKAVFHHSPQGDFFTTSPESSSPWGDRQTYFGEIKPWRLSEIARCAGSILRAATRGTLEPALLCVNASEVRLYGEFKLLHKDFFECRDIILLIENQHGFLVIDGIYTTERKRTVSMSY